MKVKVADLENFFTEIVSKLNEDEHDEIDIDIDYYYHITGDEMDVSNTESPQILIGSIDDDIQSLQETMKNGFLTYVDFDRVSAILKAISQTLNPI